ncbi:Golgin candidate 4 [Nymphaea thermarum]|nr:Golgin candidate 4 [Nymphaea thermarum]
MRNSIASLKENLSRIALDVHGDTDDDEFAGSLVGQDGPESDRRVSQRLAQSKHSTISNGNAWSHQAQNDAVINLNLYTEFARSLEESNSALEALRADHEVLLTEMKQLREQLEKERVDSTSTKLQLEEMKELHDCLDKKTLEVERLQLELNRRDAEETVQASESMPKSISALEKEITDLKIKLSKFSHEKEKVEATTLYLEQKLNDACHERDKAVQEVARLKKHLLDKHFEESEKMDADSKLIEELQANCELQRTRIMQLESSLRQASSSQEEMKKINGSELHRSNEIIKELRQKLASCMSTIDSRNVELLNLQTALGQYYAESEAKAYDIATDQF